MKLENKLNCLAPTPFLMQLNITFTGLVFIFLILGIIYLVIRSIILKIKKKKVVDKHFKKNLIWIVPATLHFVLTALLRDHYFYLLALIVTPLIIFTSLYLAIKKDLINFSKPIKLIGILIGFILLSSLILFGLRTAERFELIEEEVEVSDETDEDVITIENPIGGCKQSFY